MLFTEIFWCFIISGYLVLFKNKLSRINGLYITLIVTLCVVAYSICADSIEIFTKLTGRSYYNIMIAVATLGLLELFRRANWKENKAVDYISRNTLGVYLLQGQSTGDCNTPFRGLEI